MWAPQCTCFWERELTGFHQGEGELHAKDPVSLDVYLLINRSGAMGGRPIAGVNRALESLIQRLGGEQSVASLRLSVISFGNEATVDVLLAELQSVYPPVLHGSGSASLGAAISLLNTTLERESAFARSSLRPLVFIITEGAATDGWRDPASQLNKARARRLVWTLALSADPYVDLDELTEVAETVIFPTDQRINVEPAYEDLFGIIERIVRGMISRGAAVEARPLSVDLPQGFRIAGKPL